MLERGGVAEGQPLLGCPDGLGQRRGGADPADLPAGHGEGLGRRRDRDGAVAHPGQAGQRSMPPLVDEVLVGLVGDGDQVVVDAHARDRRELVVVEDLARRVVRRVEDQQAGAVGDGATQLVDVEGEVRRSQPDRAVRAPGHGHVGPVGVVPGFEEHHLVARFAQGQDRGGHPLGRAGADGDLGVRVDVEVPEATLVVGDRLAQCRDPDARGVLVLAVADGADGGLEHLGWSVGVREALAEVDRVVLGRQRRHRGEDRRPDALQAAGQVGGTVPRSSVRAERRGAGRLTRGRSSAGRGAAAGPSGRST